MSRFDSNDNATESLIVERFKHPGECRIHGLGHPAGVASDYSRVWCAAEVDDRYCGHPLHRETEDGTEPVICCSVCQQITLPNRIEDMEQRLCNMCWFDDDTNLDPRQSRIHLAESVHLTFDIDENRLLRIAHKGDHRERMVYDRHGLYGEFKFRPQDIATFHKALSLVLEEPNLQIRWDSGELETQDDTFYEEARLDMNIYGEGVDCDTGEMRELQIEMDRTDHKGNGDRARFDINVDTAHQLVKLLGEYSETVSNA